VAVAQLLNTFEDSHPASLDAYLLALHKRDAFIANWITAPLQTEIVTYL